LRSFNSKIYIKMALSPAPLHADVNGRLVASGLPGLHPGFRSNVQGGLLEHGAAKTAAAIKAQAGHARAAGVTMRGGGYVEVPHSSTIQGGTIPGVNQQQNMADLLKANAGLRTGAVYDGLAGTTPHRVSIGGRKRRSRTNGRHRRNHKRGNRKSRSRSRSRHRTKRRSH
jgi:hypothetical protein